MEKILPSHKNKRIDLISLLLRSNKKILLAIKRNQLHKIDFEMNNRQTIVEEIRRRNINPSTHLAEKAKSDYERIVSELGILVSETREEIKAIRIAKNLTKKYQLGMTSK